MNFSADTTSGREGEALFRDIRARHPDMPVILLTAWTHLESAVGLVKSGAADYLGKPWDDRNLLAKAQPQLFGALLGGGLTQALRARATSIATR